MKKWLLLFFFILISQSYQVSATYCHVSVSLPATVKDAIKKSIQEYINDDLDARELQCKTQCNKNKKCVNECADRFFDYGEQYKKLTVRNKLMDINVQSGKEILTVKDGLFPFHMTLCYDEQSLFYQCKIEENKEDLKQLYLQELQGMSFTISKIDVFGKYVVALLSPDKIVIGDKEMSDTLHVSLATSQDPKVLKELKERIAENLLENNDPVTLSVEKGVSCH